MLPKNRRIQRNMFSLLIRGHSFRDELLLLRFCPNSEDFSRFSFSVSKKVSKSAVVRNRLRRLGYRLIKEFIPNIKLNRLISFSFLKIPKNEGVVKSSLENLLKNLK